MCPRRANREMIEQLRQRARDAEAEALMLRRRHQYAEAEAVRQGRYGGVADARVSRDGDRAMCQDLEDDGADRPPPARSVKQRIRPRFVPRRSSHLEPRTLARRTYGSWFNKTWNLTTLYRNLNETGPHLTDGLIMEPFHAAEWRSGRR